MAIGNPYYVEPLGGLDVGAKLTQVLEGGRQVQRRKEWEDTAAGIIQSGDPNAISQLMIKYPEMTDTIQKAIGLSPSSMSNLTGISKQILTTGDITPDILIAQAESAKQKGENPAIPLKMLKQYSEGDFEGLKKTAELQLAFADPKAHDAYAKAVGKAEEKQNRTEIEGYADLLNQASIEETGKPLSPREKASAMLSYKRAQASETYANRAAQRVADQETAQNIAYNGELGKQLAVIESAADLRSAKGEISPEEKRAGGKSGVTGKLAKMAQYYTSLDSMGGIVNVENSTVENIIASSKSSGLGQAFGRIVGSDAQSFRDAINNMKPLLLNDVRQSTDMGARGLDSEKELAFYLQAATDEKRSLQANMAAIIAFDEAYGSGEVADKLRESNNISGVLIDAIKSQGEAILQGRTSSESGGNQQPINNEEQYENNDPLGIR